jgi:hypothetical protein
VLKERHRRLHVPRHRAEEEPLQLVVTTSRTALLSDFTFDDKPTRTIVSAMRLCAPPNAWCNAHRDDVECATRTRNPWPTLLAAHSLRLRALRAPSNPNAAMLVRDSTSRTGYVQWNETLRAYTCKNTLVVFVRDPTGT